MGERPRPARGEAIDLVLFDCDGVLVDSEPIAARVLLGCVAERGVTIDPKEADDRFLGRSMAAITAILRDDYGCAFGEDGLADMRERLFAAFRAELKPTAGIASALERLSVPFCVASSSQVERIRLALSVTGLLPHFEGRIFSASMVRNGKPAPDLFLYAAGEMGVPPERCLVVEDSPAGVTAAHRAGMRVLGYWGGSHAANARHRAALEAVAPVATFNDMDGLSDLIGGLEDPPRVVR
ncbi:MAG: HAD family hydrolase [Rhodospirillum sp.]|nr:HAD family hydrolase [Rhodospirillum sp.]MCF8491007.1 HAD family hydrolase [Rhodospirillum sp.]MCF8499474.1 HAD family hydrolase [Rhodospirillum sp.]